jgi:trehalose 6-phosphate synthase
VLVLSRLTGAADEIEDAILINPFNVDGVVEGLRRAIGMPLPERRARMQRMRAQLARATIFDWLEAILARVADLADETTRPDDSRPALSIAERAMRPPSPPDVSVA